MSKKWIVKCVCGAWIGCEPPNSPQFEKNIRCNICGQPIDSSKGREFQLSQKIEEEFNFLKVD